MMLWKFLLITAVLQIFLITVSSEPQKGDIVRYPRICNIYNHYALYVGRGNDSLLPNKPADKDTFEMTKVGIRTGCVFGKLENDYEIFNDYENMGTGAGFTPRSWTEMVADINRYYRNCGRWKISNTCEHIATKIRYGPQHSVCLQNGTKIQRFCRPNRGEERPVDID